MMLQLLLLFMVQPPSSRADTLTPPNLAAVLAQMEATPLISKGHALVFGYETLQSCAFAGKDLLVMVNYCYPAKHVPARSVTFWSKAFGVVELYEETLKSGEVKRDIDLNEFPEPVQNIFSLDFPSITFDTINSVSKKLYGYDNPACWVTDLDRNTGSPGFGCINTDINQFSDWVKRSNAFINSSDWDSAFARVKAKVGH